LARRAFEDYSGELLLNVTVEKEGCPSDSWREMPIDAFIVYVDRIARVRSRTPHHLLDQGPLDVIGCPSSTTAGHRGGYIDEEVEQRAIELYLLELEQLVDFILAGEEGAHGSVPPLVGARAS
jgi:hypothetical protein